MTTPIPYSNLGLRHLRWRIKVYIEKITEPELTTRYQKQLQIKLEHDVKTRYEYVKYFIRGASYYAEPNSVLEEDILKDPSNEKFGLKQYLSIIYTKDGKYETIHLYFEKDSLGTLHYKYTDEILMSKIGDVTLILEQLGKFIELKEEELGKFIEKEIKFEPSYEIDDSQPQKKTNTTIVVRKPIEDNITYTTTTKPGLSVPSGSSGTSFSDWGSMFGGSGGKNKTISTKSTNKNNKLKSKNSKKDKNLKNLKKSKTVRKSNKTKKSKK